ncbi:leucine carboxyl methyltransferase 1-like isoform X1 [Dysidea avara]|uniref:leucine carboxyl methyltransferase 1-like isoform X1 n=1 Tax=Dysidea avara TaxID=196820 RepID=UPI00332150FE
MAAICSEGITEDEAIIATNNDATSCKRYATEKGYWRDEFVKHFCKKAERKSPEISRGYYARVTALHNLVTQFVSLTKTAGLKSQVISLGAGFDTTYWRLCSVGLQPTNYFEVDLATVTSKKCQYIKTKLPLLDALQGSHDPLFGVDEINSTHYHLVAGDLRDTEQLDRKLLAAGVDKKLPTVFITECVLVYIEPKLSSQLIEWAGKHFSTSMFLNYEPFNANDTFGQVMKKNIKARGCSLLGIDACPDLESQQRRYLNNGWSASWAVDMDTVYQQLLPADEISRVERLEFLDEGDLLTQLLRHYCISVGYNDKNDVGLAGVNLHGTAHR